MKIMKAAITAALGISMASAPVLAQSAAPLSVARAGAEAQNASQIDDYDGYLLPAAVLLVVMIAIIVLMNDDGDSTSP